MLLAPYLAELLAERFVTGVTPERLAMFDPDRFDPEAPGEATIGLLRSICSGTTHRNPPEAR